MKLFTTAGEQVPGCRIAQAHLNSCHKNLLFVVGGGLGDVACAEPTLNYALRTFSECKMTLACKHPELFSHLPFDDVFTLGGERQPVVEDYLKLPTYLFQQELGMQFFDPNAMHCVDFCSLAALRMILPPCEKELLLSSAKPPAYELAERDVVLHPGLSWPSRTFPVAWWNQVIHYLKSFGCRPVLIGTTLDTLPVTTSGCLDLRGATSVLELAWVCQHATVVITNDSSPLHFAVSSDPEDPDYTGNAWVGFLATARHPDYLFHWRRGELGWRMENLEKGGLWCEYDFCPNQLMGYDLVNATAEQLASWLPEARSVAEWGAAKTLHAPGKVH